MAQAFTDYHIVDGDGHIFEDIPAIVRRMPRAMQEVPQVRLGGPFPPLDHLHLASYLHPEGSFQDPGVKGWADFLDAAQFEASALFPSLALGYGRQVDTDLSIAACRAYNDWLAETYLASSGRLHGMAIIPLQDPKAAAAELRRAVNELGMKGAMLPPTGLPMLLGHAYYAPVYEEANRLGCALCAHGGAHPDLGLNQQTIFAATHALGHPTGIAISFVDMLFNGLFDKYPKVKFGYMEAGVGWFIMVMERAPGSYGAFTPQDPNGRFLKVGSGRELRERVQGYIDNGQLFIGVEGDENCLPYAIQSWGSKPFVFSSDFPHEVNHESIREEIEELLELDSLTEEDKKNVLRNNAVRLFSL